MTTISPFHRNVQFSVYSLHPPSEIQYEDGSKYVGPVEHDLPNGLGYREWPNGDRLEGQWTNGYLNGFGTLISKSKNMSYSGSFRDNLFFGFGISTEPDGSVYVGYWENSQPNGRGMLIKDGNIYIGDWVNGKKEGKGKQTLANGNYYQGSWHHDMPSGVGYGKLPLSDESTYEGDLLNGMPDGIGAKKWPDGRSYEGSWKNGLRDGPGIFFDLESCQAGFWEHDRLDPSSRIQDQKLLKEFLANSGRDFYK